MAGMVSHAIVNLTCRIGKGRNAPFQSVAVNAELATFFNKLLEKIEVLAKPTLHAAYTRPGSNTRVVCADKDNFRSSIIDPIEWLFATNEDLRTFIDAQCKVPLRKYIENIPEIQDTYLVQANMFAALLKDVRSEFDFFVPNKLLECRHFRHFCAPLLKSKEREFTQQTI